MKPLRSPLTGGRRRLAAAALAGACALVLIAPAAPAGIRDMVKSAKDKASGQKPAAAAAGQDIAFDGTILELNGELLDRLIACRQAAASATPGRSAAVERRTAIPKEIRALSDKHGAAITENDNRRAEVGNCVAMEVTELKDARFAAEQQQMMANPTLAQKYAKISTALYEAQQKSDTAAVARLTRDYQAMFAPTAADTAAALKKCGPMPAVHPAKVRIDALDAELAGVDGRLRDMDRKALELQVDQCKLTEGQIAMAWERIELYLQNSKRGARPGGFSSTELEALAARRAALEAAVAG